MSGFTLVTLKTDLQVGVPGEQPQPVVQVGGGAHPVEQPGAPPPPADGDGWELLELSPGEDEADHQLSVLQQVDKHVEGAAHGRQEVGEVVHDIWKNI